MRAVWLGGSALLLAAGAAVAQNGSGDPAENWAKVAECARSERADQRHACVDAVLRAVGLLDRARETAQQRETFGQQPVRERPQPAPPPAVAAPAPAQARTPARAPAAAPPAPIDRIDTTITRAFDPGNRLMVIMTADGQVWQQNESKDLGLPPRAGTAFSIEKGALGSFICRIGTGRSFRCRRHD